MMSQAGFLNALEQFPKDTINDEICELLQPYFDAEDYNQENAKRVSRMFTALEQDQICVIEKVEYSVFLSDPRLNDCSSYSPILVNIHPFCFTAAQIMSNYTAHMLNFHKF